MSLPGQHTVGGQCVLGAHLLSWLSGWSLCPWQDQGQPLTPTWLLFSSCPAALLFILSSHLHMMNRSEIKCAFWEFYFFLMVPGIELRSCHSSQASFKLNKSPGLCSGHPDKFLCLFILISPAPDCWALVPVHLPLSPAPDCCTLVPVQLPGLLATGIFLALTNFLWHP